MAYHWRSSLTPLPSRVSSRQAWCAAMKRSRTQLRFWIIYSESLQFLILGVTSELMLIQMRSAAQHSAPATQANACVRRKLTSRQASPVVASANVNSLGRARRKAPPLRRKPGRRDLRTMQFRTRQDSPTPPHRVHTLLPRRSSMSLALSKRSLSVAPMGSSPNRSLRVMKGKHAENAETLPLYETVRVLNAIRAVRRADVARVI